METRPTDCCILKNPINRGGIRRKTTQHLKPHNMSIGTIAECFTLVPPKLSYPVNPENPDSDNNYPLSANPTAATPPPSSFQS